MGDTTASRLADEIEALIRATPGVTALYPTAAIPAVVVGEVLAQTIVADAVPKLVGIRIGIDRTTVAASVGVVDDVPAPATGRLVHTRILEYLERVGAGAEATEVTVRIGLVGS